MRELMALTTMQKEAYSGSGAVTVRSITGAGHDSIVVKGAATCYGGDAMPRRELEESQIGSKCSHCYAESSPATRMNSLLASSFRLKAPNVLNTEAATVLLRTLLFTLCIAFSFRRHKVVPSPSTEAMDVLAQLEHDGFP